MGRKSFAGVVAEVTGFGGPRWPRRKFVYVITCVVTERRADGQMDG